MAYDFIPKSNNDIKKAGVFMAEHARVYDYLYKKFNRVDPIALSRKLNEMKVIKISRGFQASLTLPDLKKELKLNDVKVQFGEGSRGGRGAANKGNLFEQHLGEDLNTWWNDEKDYKNNH